jgi:hypothetical protein
MECLSYEDEIIDSVGILRGSYKEEADFFLFLGRSPPRL